MPQDPKEKNEQPAAPPVYTTPKLNEQGAPLDTRFVKPNPVPEAPQHADPKEGTSAARRPKSEEESEAPPRRSHHEEEDDKRGSKKRR